MARCIDDEVRILFFNFKFSIIASEILCDCLCDDEMEIQTPTHQQTTTSGSDVSDEKEEESKVETVPFEKRLQMAEKDMQDSLLWKKKRKNKKNPRNALPKKERNRNFRNENTRSAYRDVVQETGGKISSSRRSKETRSTRSDSHHGQVI